MCYGEFWGQIKAKMKEGKGGKESNEAVNTLDECQK